MNQPFLSCVLLGSLILAFGCQSPNRFTRKDSKETGIRFVNRVEPTVGFSILDYPYFYNGGGVAVADFDQDGLQDLYFTANQAQNRIYRNLGGWEFDDLTEQSQTGGPLDEWATGVTVVDINADGWPDLYVCYLSGELGQSGVNRLFVNQGDFRFEEQAIQYGLDLKGMCTQAAFFDYDHDGDLDCYLLKHSVRPAEVVRDTALRRQRDPWAGDQLLRNDDGTYLDVSEAAGISGSRLGYGLNVMVSDWNNDSWPDIYICNDFQEDDYFYLNNGDGTFSNRLREYFGHTSRFSMGGDFADVNEDGVPDILTLDMKPKREDILKTAEAPESYDAYTYKLSFGYHHQVSRNALQISQNEQGFSDISQLAGVDATDWSWGAVFGDLNMDGRQDIFITNSIYRRPNDMDYIKFLSEPGIKRELSGEPSQAQLRFIERMPAVPLPNPILIRQPGTMRFEDIAAQTGASEPRFSNGSALADLDNDGDLDLIENNLNSMAGLYENIWDRTDSTHTLQIDLRQEGENPFAIGARVEVLFMDDPGRRIIRENMPTRGFLSSQPARLHLSWLENKEPIHVQIIWPDGKVSIWPYSSEQGNQVTLRRSELIQQRLASGSPRTTIFLFGEGPDFHHHESAFVDFNREPLIPHMLSREGPTGLYAPGPGNPTGLFIGGGAGQANAWFEKDGQTWQRVVVSVFEENASSESVDATLADLDGDGVQELYVVNGGYEFPEADHRYQDRLYRWDGARWEMMENALPQSRQNGSCVVAWDADRDGDQDLFVGSRAVPGRYGVSPRSQFLVNDGQGGFTDEAARHSLDSLGMITDAIVLDWDGDGHSELVTAGEWSSIRVWTWSDDGKMEELSPESLEGTAGFWNHLQAMDIDGDGDQDILGGNLGWNSDLQASAEEPCLMYVEDWDNNGQVDPVICRTDEGRHLTWASRDELLGQLSYLHRKYPSYASFAGERVEDIFGGDQIAAARTLEVQTFSSIWLENQGNGQWQRHELPWQAQAFPVFASCLLKNHALGPAVLLGGNQFGVGPRRGRYDAGQGLLMCYRNGSWIIVDEAVWGELSRSEVRGFIRTGERELLVLRNAKSVRRLFW